MLSHYLLASVVCDDKSALNFIEDPLHTIIQFDLNTSKILSWALLSVWLWFILLWIILSFSYLGFVWILECTYSCFHKIGGQFQPLLFKYSFCHFPFFLWFWVLHPFVKSNAQMCATISKSWKGPSRVCLASSFILYLLCWVRGSKPRTCLRSCNQLARDLEESRALSSKPSHANILSPCTHIALSSTSSVFSIILSILPPISGFSVMTNSTFTFFWLFSQDLIQE